MGRQDTYKIKQMEDIEAAYLGIPLNSAIFPFQGKERGKKRKNPYSLMNNLYYGESVGHDERMKRVVATDIARRIALKRSRIFRL